MYQELVGFLRVLTYFFFSSIFNELQLLEFVIPPPPGVMVLTCVIVLVCPYYGVGPGALFLENVSLVEC